MRVCLFTDTLGDLNGVSRFIQDMGELAREDGWQLTLITATQKPLPQAENVVNLAFRLRLPMPFYQELDFVWPSRKAIRQVLMRLQPDAVHISTPGPFGWLAKVEAQKLGIVLIGTYHTDFPAYIYDLTGSHWLKRRTDKVMAKFYAPFAKVLSRSLSYTEVMAADLSIAQAKMAVIDPGTHLQKFNPSFGNPQIWPKFGLSAQRLKVLYVGRINIEKNIPFLCQLWQALQQTCPQVEADLVMVGEGRYRKWTDRMRPYHAYFLGPVVGEDLSQLYASADLFIFPSTTDTLGQVVMEAQASGLGCLVSDVGGPQSLVVPEQTGRVLAANRQELWLEALKEVLQNPRLRAVWQEQASLHMQQYDIRRSYDFFKAVHQTLKQDESSEAGVSWGNTE